MKTSKPNNPLRTVRIVLALLSFSAITLLFFGTGREWWGWMAKIQFLPSVIRLIGSATLLNAAILAALVALTLIFGRIYCSVICPLGVFQDIIIWLRRKIGLLYNKIYVRKAKTAKLNGKKPEALKPVVKHFSFSPERKYPRYIILAATVVAVIAGMQLFIAFIAPYSSYGRIVRSIIDPSSGAAAVIGFATLAIISVCAWFWGRIWCNAICPVGTVLGVFSRASVMKIHIDADKCTACGRCGRGCKSACIDMDAHSVDYSRCVECFDCISRCKEGAITYGPAPKTKNGTDRGRRAFLATGAFVAGSLALKAQDQGGLAVIEDKVVPHRNGILVPPGAGSGKRFYDLCTACGLCISNCPNGVLRSSADLRHLAQPEMGYEKGFCRPECTACSDVCPAGAILPLKPGQKHTISIGIARVDLDGCLANDGENCGNCARHCTAGAIRMVTLEDGRKIPAVNEERCIGCGACEFLCPVRPVSAITVDGREVHRKYDE
ncbi:MAG: 4Fe-4S dicluster domain-containing protein [Bacteroidales bacterium]|nr:4Fe-4S dicluster domain-containing protein [Bacteroidales bacterium]